MKELSIPMFRIVVRAHGQCVGGPISRERTVGAAFGKDAHVPKHVFLRAELCHIVCFGKRDCAFKKCTCDKTRVFASGSAFGMDAIMPSHVILKREPAF